MAVLVAFRRHQQRMRGDLEPVFNPRQATLLRWISRRWSRVGLVRPISRRTLNRWLAGLEALRFINRVQNNWDPLTRKVLGLASTYTFARRGLVWIKENAPALGDLGGRLGVSGLTLNVASSFKVLGIEHRRGARAVEKAPTAPSGKIAALRRRTSSTTRSAARAPRKAPVRKGARPTPSTLRKHTAGAARRRRARR